MAVAKYGKVPDYFTIFYETHTKKTTDGVRVPIDSRSKKFMEDLEHARTEIQTKYATKDAEGTPIDVPVEELNEVFLKTTYKHSRGSYLYGTGKNKPAGSFSSTTSIDFQAAKSEIEELKEKLKKMESQVQASVVQAVDERIVECIAKMSQEVRPFVPPSCTDSQTQVSDPFN